jgi:CubicO group peptidase (beta-lactamase class C family)
MNRALVVTLLLSTAALVDCQNSNSAAHDLHSSAIPAAAVAPASPAVATDGPWPDPDWQTAAPEAEGFDSGQLADGIRSMRQRQIHVHSILIVRYGRLVLDATFFPFRPNETHDLASCTKSVTSTLIGAAITRGDLHGINQPVLPIFGERSVAHPDARKDRIRLADLLSMRSGLDCHVEHSEETLQQMQAAPHWVPFMLDLPMATDPGTNWVYCSGGMHVLSGVISRVEGRSALEFAKEALFGPLGIEAAVWPSDPDGISTGWGNLELRPHDMAKLGYLWLHQGTWNRRRILNPDYMRQATSPLAVANAHSEYGFGFWVYSHRQPPMYEANGRGGQRIVAIPEKNVVLVLTGGGFDTDDIGAFLGPAMHDAPLPPNPAAQARLKLAVADVALPPAVTPAPPLPELAGRISGRTYRLSPPPFEMAALTFRFGQPNQAEVVIAETNGRQTTRPIGLDGVPRLSPNLDAAGHLIALQGEWKTADTFLLNVELVAKINRYQLTLTFQGDALIGEMAERTGLGEAAFKGAAD